MKFCTQCGAEIKSADQQFCENCGAPLVVTDSFCPKCGTPVGSP